MPKTDHRVNLSDRKIQSLKPAAKGARYQVMDAEVLLDALQLAARHRLALFAATRDRPDVVTINR